MRPVYAPIPREEWREETRNLNSDEKRVFLRRTRQGESDALNHATKVEIETAAFTGKSIAHVMFEHRKDEQTIGGKGWSAFQRACKALDKDPVANAGGSQQQAAQQQAAQQPDPQAAPQGLTAEQQHDLQAAIHDAAMAKHMADQQAQMIDDLQAQMNQPIHVTVPDQPEPIVIEGAHEAFGDCLRTAMVHRRLLMHGPKGSGKSTIVRSIAKAMGMEYRIISCTAETSIHELLGSRDANGVFHPGPVLEAYENGMLLFLDEFDALDPATGVALNAYLDGGDHAPIPMRTGAQMANRHDAFLPAIAVNTLSGATRDYSGRMKQDGATMSRFPALVRRFVDYSRKIEGQILGNVPELATRLWDLRDKVREYNLDESRMITTRDFASVAMEVAYRGGNPKDAMTDDMIVAGVVADWTDEEKRKVGCC
jgi:energy-coupling factor transporter ATP-binding protein EcfA2